MPTIDNRLIDGFGEAEISENFNRVLGLIDSQTARSGVIDAEQGIGTPVNAVAAKVTLTLATQPTANDTMTIGAKVYTFKATAAADRDIGIGVDVAATRLLVVGAINGTGAGQVCTAHPNVSCAAFSSSNAVISAKVKGVSGNAITATETFAAVGNVFSSATLIDGVDGTPGLAGAILTDGVKIYVCTAANTISGANWKSASLT